MLKKVLLYCLVLSVASAYAQQRYIDSLTMVFAGMADDTSKVNTLNELSKVHNKRGESEVSLKYAKQALQLSENLGYSKGKAEALGNMGMSNWSKGDFDIAYDFFINSLSISQEKTDKIGVAAAYNGIGLCYLSKGDYKKSLDSFYKSLKIKNEINDKPGLANTYLNIGNLYSNQGNFEKALEFYSKSLALNIELGDKTFEATNLNNIGVLYFNKNDISKSLEYYLKSLKIYKELGDKRGLAMTLLNVGLIYTGQKKYQDAFDNLMKSVEIFAEIDNKLGVGVSYLNIGCVYFQQNKLDQAFTFFNKSLVVLKPIGYKMGVKEAYVLLAELFQKKGDYKQAYEYHKLYSEMKDSILNEESNKQIAEMNSKYESEKKEKEIELLTKDKELQGAEISKQKLIRNGTIGGLIIALLFGFVLLNRFRVTNKQKKIIEYQNEQIVESINYSKKIQDSLLPAVREMQQALPSLFVYNKPKDIVSGDFYYFKEYEKHLLIACVDCTGHGVPGGFMSTLGSLLLDKITDKEVLSPSEILSKLSDEIIRVLHQQNGGEIQDGMDLSICLIDKENKKVEFSGARNGIVVVGNNQAKRYKANPLPVGGNYMKKGSPIVRNFETLSIPVNSTDWIYMYTDGFMEQSGGLASVPMTSIEFEDRLIRLSKTPQDSKLQFLDAELSLWAGSNERSDDVLIVGFQLG